MPEPRAPSSTSWPRTTTTPPAVGADLGAHDRRVPLRRPVRRRRPRRPRRRPPTEARELARAGGGDRRAAALDEQQPDHPRDGRLGRDGPRRDAGRAHRRVRRRTRSSACRPAWASTCPSWRCRTPGSPRRWSAKFARRRRLLRRPRRAAPRGRRVRPHPGRLRGRGRPSSSSTRWLGDPGRRGPDARRAGPARRASTRPAGASGCRPSSASRCGRPSSATATCCATRSPRTPGPTSGAG